MQDDRVSLCSLTDAVEPTSNKEMASTARVLLGVSETRADVQTALKYGRLHFVDFLATRSFASTIASILYTQANNGERSLPVTPSDIREVIQHFLQFEFDSASVERIGMRCSYDFQRFGYNCVVCILALYETRLKELPSCRSAVVGALRRAIGMCADVVEAIKVWMPVAPWLNGWWTKWHAIAYIFEITTGTLISRDAKFPFCFSIFADIVAENARAEKESLPTSAEIVTQFKTSTFAWIACSTSWTRAFEVCNKEFGMLWTPNVSLFLTDVKLAFAHPSSHSSSQQSSHLLSQLPSQPPSQPSTRPSTPIADDICKKRSAAAVAAAYVSPETERKHARRSNSKSATPKVLRL